MIPIMLPDAQSLIRRSGAAAPLLEAIKARNAGAAVRSVIDRLIAAPAASTAPAPPPPQKVRTRLAGRAIGGRYARAEPRAPLSLASSEAAMTAMPTTPTMMLHTAFISGFTPRRTSE